MDADYQHRLSQLETVYWLADAPMFIDGPRVESFYDAVVRPQYEISQITVEDTKKQASDLKAKLNIEGKASIGLPAFLSAFLTRAEAGLSGGMEGTRHREAGEKKAATVLPIATAERKLEELALHYLVHHPDRMVLDAGPHRSNTRQQSDWFDLSGEFVAKQPRALGFLELKPGIELIPTAAEFEDGAVVLLYEQLRAKWTGEEGGPMQSYPDAGKYQAKELLVQRRSYWASFANRYRAAEAMTIIEEAATAHGRIRWIDYRLPWTTEGDTLHLHICPDTKYDAGVFGYNFVKRGFGHGVRLVGTLKSGPDMNVLAIYEK